MSEHVVSLSIDGCRRWRWQQHQPTLANEQNPKKKDTAETFYLLKSQWVWVSVANAFDKQINSFGALRLWHILNPLTLLRSKTFPLNFFGLHFVTMPVSNASASASVYSSCYSSDSVQ